jgi:pimeloyl-ACP methyl ester carboxylesterase
MFRCIAPCNRGFGYSSYNNPITSLEDLAKDIVLLIKEHLKLKRFYIYAHSMGSIMAVYLASLLGD